MNKICTVTAKVYDSNKGLGYTSLRIIGMFKKPTPKFYNKVVDEFLDILNTTNNNIHKDINLTEFKNDIISRFCDICFGCDRDNVQHYTLFTTNSVSIQITVIPVSKLNDIEFRFDIIKNSKLSDNGYCELPALWDDGKNEKTYKM